MLINRKQVAEVLGIKPTAVPHLDARGDINAAKISYSEKGTPVYLYDRDAIVEYKECQERKQKRITERATRMRGEHIHELIDADSPIDHVAAEFFIRRPYIA